MASLEMRVEALEQVLLNKRVRVFFIDTEETPDIEAEKQRILKETGGKYRAKFCVLAFERDTEQAGELSADDFKIYQTIAKHTVDL